MPHPAPRSRPGCREPLARHRLRTRAHPRPASRRPQSTHRRHPVRLRHRHRPGPRRDPAAGVVHRDVKPQNVILTPAGPRVLDFGIAHAADGTSVTRTGVMTGTPGWISPEHYRTGTAGPEGDMFAWGTLVAYAATGRLPFGTGAPDVVAYRVMTEEPDLDGLPDELREHLTKALAKNPAERISAEAAAEECARLLARQATQVLGATAEPEPTRISDHLTTAWNLPSMEDPAWGLPAPRGASARSSPPPSPQSPSPPPRAELSRSTAVTTGRTWTSRPALPPLRHPPPRYPPRSALLDPRLLARLRRPHPLL
ncbi:serine/threonine-protein kinase [Streptomyces sp. SBR177]